MERIDTGGGNLPAFPWDQASAIVLARVKQIDTYLSQDGSALFSEYVLAVDEGWKAAGHPGEMLVERAGGALLMPNRRTIRHLVRQEGFPRVDGRYVLFLRQWNGKPLPQIVRALAVIDDRLYPIDGAVDEIPEWDGVPVAGLPLEVFRAHAEMATAGK